MTVAGQRLLAAGVALAVVAVGAVQGGYGLGIRTLLGVVVWWTIALVVVLRLTTPGRIPRAALATGALLVAFGVLVGASAAWSSSLEPAFLELHRMLLYLGLFVLVVLVARPATAPAWSSGLAGGVVVIAFVALAERLLIAGAVDETGVARLLPNAASRLSGTIGYWNGLAILVALAVPLLMGASLGSRRAVLRGLALAQIPALAAVIYLASSRGGVLVAVIGALMFVGLVAPRVAGVQALALASVGSAVVLAVLRARPDLVDPALDGAPPRGTGVVLLIVATCALTGVAQGLLSGERLLRARLPPLVARAGGAAVVLTVLLGLAALDPMQRLDAFRAPPRAVAAEGFVEAHLLDGGGSGRWQFWSAAGEQFAAHPVLGGGAGSYETWWSQHGDLPFFVRDAHSLYMETLGELGALGLAMLLGAFGTALVAAIRRSRRGEPAMTAAAAGLAASFTGFLVGAGIDWMWELTVVGGFGVVLLGLLTSSATRASISGARAPTRGRRAAGAVLAVGLAVAAVAALALPYLVSIQIEASRVAVRAGDLPRAREAARTAQSLQPWAASPHLQAALVAESSGQLDEARGAIGVVIARAPRDWRPWLVAARLAARQGRVTSARRALAMARRLNPRSRLFRRTTPR